jgi:hypothetical protein
MASPRATALKREQALRRLRESSLRLSAKLALDPPEVSIRGRDMERVESLRLEALADWLEQVDAVTKPRKKKKAATDGADD